MKAVLMSINPNWCSLIANGVKTIEVRKNKPKLETPFKVYIYCTVGTGGIDDRIVMRRNHCGKVIGEFVCDEIITYQYDECIGYPIPEGSPVFLQIRMSLGALIAYGKGKDLYGWHISNLEIYDEPRALREVRRFCDGNCQSCQSAAWQKTGWAYEPRIVGCKPITRPPQSWCYVDVSEGECGDE